MADHTGCRQCDADGCHSHGRRDVEGYELRYVPESGDAVLDEVIARGCDVHLEQMDRGNWHLGIVLDDGTQIRVAICSRSGRANVDATAEVDRG